MMHAGRTATICLCVAISLVVIMIASVSGVCNSQANVYGARIALLQALGIDSLAIQSDCDSTRTPANGACACLTDIPGGYCYHSSCDVIGIPPVLEDDQYYFSVVSDKGTRHEY